MVFMVSEKTQKQIVFEYTQNNLSAGQISEKYKISETTVNSYLKRNNVQKRSIGDAIRYLNITKHGKKEFTLKKALSREEEILKVAGVMLYWGEGAKTRSSVGFTNSDPEMIAVFLQFLRIICGVDEKRIKALIHIYPDHDKTELVAFWSRVTGISKKNFYKSFIHMGKKGTYKNRSRYGTIAITYSDKKLLQTILSWVELYSARLKSHPSSVGRATHL